MSSTRAKFRVMGITNAVQQAGGEVVVSVRLVPVFGSKDDATGENARFYRYTPSGEIKLDILNPAAAAVFEVGKSYYVDFTPAD